MGSADAAATAATDSSAADESDVLLHDDFDEYSDGNVPRPDVPRRVWAVRASNRRRIMATCELDSLRELGFDAAVEKVNASKELVRKMAVAYEHFDYVSAEDIEKFQDQVKAKTLKEDKLSRSYDRLTFTNTKEYTEVPPAGVLEKMKAAKAMNCFDSFEIAKIESVQEVKDPILFGRVDKCGDYFFIAQWDDDVTIEAIKAAAGK
jgi:hypothetical protein